MKKIYIINTIHAGDDRQIFGDFAPEAFFTYNKALKGLKALCKDYNFYTCIDNVKNNFITYVEKTDSFEIESFDPLELDDDVLYEDFDGSPILIGIDIE